MSNNRSLNLPRYFIDRIFELIHQHDLIDKWNYPVRVGREFIGFLKSGEELSIEKNFLSSSRFSKFNSISTDRLFRIFYPVFKETQDMFIDNLISDFDEFLRRLKYQIQTNHAKAIYADGNPKEDYGRQIVSSAVFGFFSKEGFIYHEVPSGIGFIDILICANREIVIEAKLESNFKPDSKQLAEYVESGRNRRGYYIVFDTTKSFTHKKYCDVENSIYPPDHGYATIVCHVNPPVPSEL